MRGAEHRAERRRSATALVATSLVALLVAVLPACRREARRLEEPAYLSANAAGIRIDEAPASPPPRKGPGPYDGNAWAMSEGQRLYSQMNCSGCHFHGGGGMGPPLMDGQWLYGSDPASIFATIVEGRPNGMPSYKGRMSDQQIWQLVSFVRSLSGLAPSDAATTRDDHMQTRPPYSRTKPQGLAVDVR